MKHSFLKLTALMLALGMLAGCSTAATVPEESETMTEVTVSATARPVSETTLLGETADDVFSLNALFDSSFNPYKLTSAWNRVVDMLVYEPLIAIDGNFEAQPSIVTAWSSEDGITWTFSVDTSRTFHSGAQVNAIDCAYTLRLAATVDAYAGRFEGVSSVETVDKSSFQVKLTSVNWRFYTLLNIPVVETDTFYSSIPGGTGPYKFAATGDMLVLDENHPDAADMPLLRIYLKEYKSASDILQAFESASIDLVINDPTSLSNLGYSKTNIIRYIDSTNMHYIGYNLQSPFMSQTAVRMAMTYIVDRSTIVSSYMSGAAVSAAMPIHPNCSLYPTELARTLGYAPEKFQTVIESLGMLDVDGDGLLDIFSGSTALKLEIDFIVCGDSSAKVSAARRIANEMTALGLDVTLRELAYDDYIQALKDGDFDLYYGEIKLRPDWDLSELFRADWSASDSINYSRGSDPMVLSCYSQLRASPEENQQSAVDALCEYLAQSAPITVICFEKSEVLYHRGVISGMEPTQDNIFNGMGSWQIDLTADQS